MPRLTDPDQILTALARPFTPHEIEWRVGSTTKDKAKGIALAYIDARTVMDRFDAVMGAHWKCEYPTIQRTAAGMGEQEEGDEQRQGQGKKKPRSKSLVVCRISLKIYDEWIWREDGAGDSAVEAEKGALSDALKRAAVRWGVGRFLYSLPSPWVELDQWKCIKKEELGGLRRIAAEALAEYERNPAHRPSPQDPPSQPRFTDPAPAQPASRAASAPARPVDQLGDAIRQAPNLATRTTALATARKSDPASTAVFDGIFADLVIEDIKRTRELQTIENIAQFITRAQPRGEPAKRIREALATAREGAA